MTLIFNFFGPPIMDWDLQDRPKSKPTEKVSPLALSGLSCYVILAGVEPALKGGGKAQKIWRRFVHLV